MLKTNFSPDAPYMHGSPNEPITVQNCCSKPFFCFIVKLSAPMKENLAVYAFKTCKLK